MLSMVFSYNLTIEVEQISSKTGGCIQRKAVKTRKLVLNSELDSTLNLKVYSPETTKIDMSMGGTLKSALIWC